MKTNQLQVRVRYGETDQMGVVYYGNYAQYFEMGRTEWLRVFGISYKWMEDNGVMLPVTEYSVKYKRPARYDDVLTITTRLVKLPTARITFEYEITNGKDEVVATASTSLAFLDKKTNRPTLAPEYLMEKLRPLFE